MTKEPELFRPYHHLAIVSEIDNFLVISTDPGCHQPLSKTHFHL
jgi:hypothetical protein